MSRFSRLGPTAQGILFVIAAMACLPLMDSMAKAIAERSNPIMATWARYLGQTIAVAIVVIPKMPRVLKTRYPGLQFLRSVFLLIATTCFYFSIVPIGLANATAVLNLNPVLITLGAALLLGERFGLRRAFAVVAALVGALIVIRPGTAVFSPYALLPLAAAVFVAAYSVATRFVGRDEDAWTSLLYTAMFGAIALSFAVPFFWVTPDLTTIGLMAVIGLVGSTGHLCLIRAYMAAEASTIAPFAYAQLLFATLWGMLFFGEFPDGWTLVGALVIVGAGLYVWHRESRAQKST
ncbi:MAG: hypothetical protein CMH12_18230 [Maritimibacter sp.]|nr:hypothetical protein [Maritimibacter sp.]